MNQRIVFASACLTVALAAASAIADELRVPEVYDTIQAAVDAASPGDVVVVSGKAVYREQVVVRAAVGIRGWFYSEAFADAGALYPEVYDQGPEVSYTGGGPAIVLAAPGAWVEGLTVESADVGIRIESAGVHLRDVRVRNCGGDAVQIDGAIAEDADLPEAGESSRRPEEDSDAEERWFDTGDGVSAPARAIEPWNSQPGTVRTIVLLSGVLIEDCEGDGVRVEDSALVTLDYVVIHRVGGAGLRVTDSPGVEIVDGTVWQCGGAGIDALRSPVLTIDGVWVLDAAEEGIAVRECDDTGLWRSDVCGAGADSVLVEDTAHADVYLQVVTSGVDCESEYGASGGCDDWGDGDWGDDWDDDDGDDEGDDEGDDDGDGDEGEGEDESGAAKRAKPSSARSRRGPGRCGIVLSGCRDSRVDRAQVAGGGHAGIAVDGSSIRVTRNRVRRTPGDGIVVAGDRIDVRANRIRSVRRDGVRVHGLGHRVRDNRITAPGRDAIVVEDDAAAGGPGALAAVDPSIRTIVSGNSVMRARRDGVRVRGLARVDLIGNQVHRSRAVGIRVRGTGRAAIDGNVSRRNRRYDLLVAPDVATVELGTNDIRRTNDVVRAAELAR